MIARLRGKPVARTPDGLVLEVAGVGYLVAASSAALRKADGGHEVVVETYLHVREDALQLYGFADAAERELFTQLLTVVVAWVFCGAMTFVILKIVGAVVGLRVPEQEEVLGLDISQHGEPAYQL